MDQPVAPPPYPVRVLSVDDHPFLAEGLKARLESEPGLQFVGHRARADGLIDAVVELAADIVLLDIELPGADPFESTARLRRAVPAARVIMLSAYVRDHYVDGTVKAGAWGYLSKSDDPASIIQAIRDVAGGKFTFGPMVLERCRQMGRAAGPGGSGVPEPAASRLASLSPREVQVLRMIAKGLSRNDIAKAMYRSPKTVDAHRSAIMEKLQIRDRVELARFAIREGLVEL